MNWKLKQGCFVLEGARGFAGLTSTRWRGLPPGEFSLEDLRRAVERMGVRPKAVIGMGQVHGATVRAVDGRSDRLTSRCDGSITRQPGVALVVRTADCLPIIVFDPARKVLGIAHAGWRGVRAGIPRRLVKEMGGAEVEIAIGPGIGFCCYEVGPEFEEWFPQHLVYRRGRRFLDLAGAARSQLMEAGVPEEKIHGAGWCTACTPDHCHSYRRDGAAAGRMLTVAMMKTYGKVLKSM